jgi:hypothetical protein
MSFCKTVLRSMNRQGDKNEREQENFTHKSDQSSSGR